MPTEIDPRAAEAHEWLAGYSRALAGNDEETGQSSAYIRGFRTGEKQRAVVLAATA